MVPQILAEFVDRLPRLPKSASIAYGTKDSSFEELLGKVPNLVELLSVSAKILRDVQKLCPRARYMELWIAFLIRVTWLWLHINPNIRSSIT